MNALSEFHFLYPLWFMLLPLVLLFWWWLSRQNTQSQAWQHFIDERLKPFVISGKEGVNSRWLRHGLLVGALVSIVALSGPSWQKRELPAFQSQQGLVLVLDLSISMLATDVPPNRHNRARFKLLDLLKIREEGQTGLVVFAGDAFAVSPLTDDVENIIEQAKNLSPQIMPAQGSLIYRGIDEAVLLLQQASYATGDILVIADGVNNLSRALQSAEASAAAGYRVSVAAIGTKEGALIPVTQNDYLRDSKGQLVTARLDIQSLEDIANKGGGIFEVLGLSDDDVEGFQHYFSQDKSSVLDNKKTTVEHWHNEGIWLLWALLLPALLLFRKGYLFSLGLCAFALGVLLPQPASAFSWDELWLNADQRAHRALVNDKHEQAKTLFKSKDWKASAAYKNGDFEESASLFASVSNADGYYNQGNALAKSGKMEESMKAYDKALALQTDHRDAAFNLDLLKKMQEQQKKDQEKQQGEGDKNDSKDKQQGQEGQEGQEKKDQVGPEQNKGDQVKQRSEAEKKKAKAAEQQAEEETKKRAEAAKQEIQKQSGKKGAEKKPTQDEMTEEQKEQARQTQQWLHKIPDDSAGLWRRKFRYQYRQRQPADQQEQQQW